MRCSSEDLSRAVSAAWRRTLQLTLRSANELAPDEIAAACLAAQSAMRFERAAGPLISGKLQEHRGIVVDVILALGKRCQADLGSYTAAVRPLAQVREGRRVDAVVLSVRV